MYPFFRHHVTTRASVDSPLEIALNCNYDSVTNQGTIDATVENTSASAVAGNIHFVVIEYNIPYTWGGGSELDHVMRDMLPDANGEAVTIPAVDTIMRSRSFTIDTTWDDYNCKIVVFVQAANRAIFQGAETALIPQPAMTYYEMVLSEVTGNGNGYAEPGELMQVEIVGKNLGTGPYTAPTMVTCSDPYISIAQLYVYVYSIDPGDCDTVSGWTFNIAPTCPAPYLAEFSLIFGSGDTSNIPVLITTQPGLADDFESGQGDWTHSGIADNWHLTEYRSNSPTHSWYCGSENVWHYTNQNDASLISPYFVVPPDSALSFYHYYQLETDWDYSYVEVDNGSGLWQTLDEYNGSQTTWTQASYPLSGYNCQTARIRFRFVSDYSVYEEGWYVDDVLVPMLGVEELNPAIAPGSITLNVSPNIFRHTTEITYTMPEFRSSNFEMRKPSLKIYDASGRLVKSFDPESCIMNRGSGFWWDGRDDQNRVLGSGVYFVTLQTADRELTEKVILLK